MMKNIIKYHITKYNILRKYNKLLEKVKNSIKNEFDNEPVYNES